MKSITIRSARPTILRNSTQSSYLNQHHIDYSHQRSYSYSTNCDAHKLQRRRVVVTGLGAITPIGPDMNTTWKAVLQPNDSKNSEVHDGITSLQCALRRQNLGPAQFDREWEVLKQLSCQVAASVPSTWITHHPNFHQSGLISNKFQTWNDGRTSRFVQLALIAAREAMAHSGLDLWLGNFDFLNSDSKEHEPQDEKITNRGSNELYRRRREAIGVSIGNGMSSTRDISLASSLLSSQSIPSSAYRKISPHFVPQILPNSPAARIAIHHNLMGPNLTHSEACAAGACAIAQAVELIQFGKVKGMIAGGCESAVDALGLAGFSRLRALSSSSHGNKNDVDVEWQAPNESSRPFDSNRNGFVLAEGAAMLVLEDNDHAIARGATILAEVVGVGYSADAFHITAPEPSGEGAARAMLNALEDCKNTYYGLETSNKVASSVTGMEDVDYINAHATSTPIGDVAELNAIQLALSRSSNMSTPNTCEKTNHCNSQLLVSSTKGATGHLLGAAGAIEAALTVSALSKCTVPHTRNLLTISDQILRILRSGGDENKNESKKYIHLVQSEPMYREIKLAMSNSFGFGGTNVSLLFGKY